MGATGNCESLNNTKLPNPSSSFDHVETFRMSGLKSVTGLSAAPRLCKGGTAEHSRMFQSSNIELTIVIAII
jgi:hypothetical protein